MKKIIFGFAVVLFAASAQASYLYWQVGSNESWANSAEYSYAGLYYGSNEAKDGRTQIGSLYGTPMAMEAQADLSSISGAS